MQEFKADDYRGKRVRLSGYVRPKGISDWAGVWMRVDGPPMPGTQMPEPLAFDNMQDRPIKGTGDWRQCNVVLDVPEKAQEIAFGILLTGAGEVWMDDLKFEVVGKATPTTGGMAAVPKRKAPKLTFEQ